MTFPSGGVKRPAAAVALLFVAGCAVRGPLFEAEPGVDEQVRTITLHSWPVSIHLATLRAEPRGEPIVLYVTGDGGWRGADPLVFRSLVHWGYPTVGFEARDYLDHLGDESPRTTRRLAHDYGRIIADAEHALGLRADTPALLVGFSRGAALAVLAAGQHSLRRRLAGVVAVALVDEEGTVHAEDAAPIAPRRPLDPYAELSRVGALPVEVIQSTNDRYVDAGAARQRFGPDTPTRRLVAVTSDGHTFSGARDALLVQLEEALRWIASLGHLEPPREEPPG
jgi:predicted alpha/beta hydrolase family esterase